MCELHDDPEVRGTSQSKIFLHKYQHWRLCTLFMFTHWQISRKITIVSCSIVNIFDWLPVHGFRVFLPVSTSALKCCNILALESLLGVVVGILAGTGTRCSILWPRASWAGSVGHVSGQCAAHARTRTFSASQNSLHYVAFILLQHEVTFLDLWDNKGPRHKISVHAKCHLPLEPQRWPQKTAHPPQHHTH